MTGSSTHTSTYSVADVETVMRRFRADLSMIAESSGTWSKTEVNNYVSDIEAIAKEGYLSFVDITLLKGNEEVNAVRYEVNTNATDLNPSRFGGVLWTRVDPRRLRLVVGYSQKWEALNIETQTAFKNRLKISWGPCQDDISHNKLSTNSTRNFVSNSYGLARKDFA
jgi:hypothetical protein